MTKLLSTIFLISVFNTQKYKNLIQHVFFFVTKKCWLKFYNTRSSAIIKRTCNVLSVDLINSCRAVQRKSHRKGLLEWHWMSLSLQFPLNNRPYIISHYECQYSYSSMFYIILPSLLWHCSFGTRVVHGTSFSVPLPSSSRKHLSRSHQTAVALNPVPIPIPTPPCFQTLLETFPLFASNVTLALFKTISLCTSFLSIISL